MLALIGVALLCSLDSFMVSTAIGPFVPHGKRWWLAAAFGICDGIGTLLGSFVSHRFLNGNFSQVPTFLVATLVFYCALSSLWAARLGRSDASHISKGRSRILYVLPVLLGLDNLGAGSAFGSGATSVVTSGCVSALLSLSGLLLGAAFCGYTSSRMRGGRYVPGVALLLTSVLVVWIG